MTNTGKRIVNNPDQLSLFDRLVNDQEARAAKLPGRMCISAPLLAAVRAAIKAAPKSREQIADDMTVLSGRKVTVGMINNWTAESHPHDLPAALAPAFCEATGDNRALMVQNDSAGIYTIEAPDKIRARLQKLEEQKKELDKEKTKYSALLYKLEGRK